MWLMMMSTNSDSKTQSHSKQKHIIKLWSSPHCLMMVFDVQPGAHLWLWVHLSLQLRSDFHLFDLYCHNIWTCGPDLSRTHPEAKNVSWNTFRRVVAPDTQTHTDITSLLILLQIWEAFIIQSVTHLQRRCDPVIITVFPLFWIHAAANVICFLLWTGACFTVW